MNERNKPVAEIRYGAVKAAVWRNETESGPRYSATFNRLYRDGDQWKNSDSFGKDELLVLAKIADEVHSWIYAQGREAPSAGGPGPTSAPGPVGHTTRSAGSGQGSPRGR